MATTFVLFTTSPAFAALGPELERRGLRFAHTDYPPGVLRGAGLGGGSGFLLANSLR